MFSKPRSSSTRPSAGVPATGQAALRRRLRFEPDLSNRALTGALLFSLQAAIAALQQYGPAEGTMSPPVFRGYIVLMLGLAGACLLVGPRLRGRAFRLAEQLVIVVGWLAVTGLVAATGGVHSVDLVLFANVVFYIAYFLPPRRALPQLIFGSGLIWLPLVYEPGGLAGDGFVARALVITAVLWAMALLVMRNRRLTQLAELEARRLALTDPLTGVANLHTFVEQLGESLELAQSDSSPLGVAFVDVNGLKAANTVHGHAGGDRLIQRTADSLLAAAGVADQVARVGGDEFAVHVAGADAAAMREFERRFALALSECRDTADGPLYDLSASIGSAVFPDDGTTTEQLMHVADTRMYDSKASLPPRLPTPGTAGGHALSGAGGVEHRMPGLLNISSRASSLAWLLAAGMILAAAGPAGGDGTRPLLAGLLAGLCAVTATALLLAPERVRGQIERFGDVAAIVIAVPAIHATGGAATPILPLAFLVVAHAAYAFSAGAAALRVGAVIGILTGVVVVSHDRPELAGVTVILAQVIVLAALLRFNRIRAEIARRESVALAHRDPLTGLANRRVFERALVATGWEDAAAGGLVLADVDDFKQVNTDGGHRTGDEVLRMIAAVLDGAAGRRATVCRIGGDEFALVVPEGGPADLRRLAASCRAAIGAVEWEDLGSAPVTMSFGCASWEQVPQWKELVAAADLAMRLSKDQGKNRVSTAALESLTTAQQGPADGPFRASRGA